MKRPPSPLSQQKKTRPHFIFSRVYLSKYSNSALVIGPLCCSCCCTYSKFKFFDTSGITRARTVLCSTCFCLLREWLSSLRENAPKKTLKPFVRLVQFNFFNWTDLCFASSSSKFTCQLASKGFKHARTHTHAQTTAFRFSSFALLA